MFPFLTGFNRMLKKYYDVMKFYIDSQEFDNFKQAKKEYLMHKEIVSNFNFYWEFKVENYPQVLKKLGNKYK